MSQQSERADPVGEFSDGLVAGRVGSEFWPMVRLYHLDAADMSHARCHAPEARWVGRFALPLAGALVLAGFVGGYLGWSTGLLHLAALYLVAERLLPMLRVTEQDAAYCGPENTRRLSLSEDELVVDSNLASPIHANGSSATYRWEQLLGYYNCPACLVLLTPERQPLLIPRVWFSALEYAALQDLVGRKVRPWAKRWVPLLRPVFVTSSLLLAWIAWELPL